MLLVVAMLAFAAGLLGSYVCLPDLTAAMVVFGIGALVTVGLVAIDVMIGMEARRRRHDKDVRDLLSDILYSAGHEVRWIEVMERRGVAWDKDIQAPAVDEPEPDETPKPRPVPRTAESRMSVGARLLLVLIMLGVAVAGTWFVYRITTGGAPRLGSDPALPAARP